MATVAGAELCRLFQSSPSPKAGRHLARDVGMVVGWVVSILAQPEGWAPHGNGGRSRALQVVSILAQPEGWAPPRAGRGHGRRLGRFNPRPARRLGATWQRWPEPSFAGCFNPRPARRLGATSRGTWAWS